MSKRASICIIIRSLANGGAEKQSILLANALQDEYHVQLVILSKEPRHHAHLDAITAYGLDHTYLEGGTFTKLKAFTALLKKHQVDLIFSYLPGDTFFAAIGGKLAGVKHIYGGMRSSLIPEWKKRVGLRFAHNHLLSATIANSHAGKDYYKDNGFNDEKTIVIPNGMIVKQDYLGRELKETVEILSVGRFVPAKDYETAIKSISMLKKSKTLNKNFKYIIIGAGELEDQLRHWIRAYKCEDCVELVIDPPNIPDYYRKADIYLCSSFFEGFSNTLMEAASFSLPIVSTDAGDNAYLAIHDETGFISPIYDANSLANHLAILINEDTIRATMGKRSYEHLLKNFSYEAFQKRYKSLLEEIFPKPTAKTLIKQL